MALETMIKVSYRTRDRLNLLKSKLRLQGKDITSVNDAIEHLLDEIGEKVNDANSQVEAAKRLQPA